MKRIFLAALVAVLVPCVAWAAGTVTVTHQRQSAHDGSYVVVFSWTSDGSGNADSTAYFPYGAYITRVVTDPGATAPDANYDITLTDRDSYDVMGGTLANRHASTTEQVVPIVHSDGTNTVFGPVHVEGTITLNISNAGASKVGTVSVYVTSAE